MKYDTQLTELKNFFPQAKNILIALTPTLGIDEVAAGLALFLSLKKAGKEVGIVTEGALKVSHSHIFGLGEIKSALPQISGGSLVITLKGVVVPDALGQPTVPSLQKIDWSPSGSDFNLFFQPVPGQKFQPTEVIPNYQGGGFDLVFIIGAANLNDLGSIYVNNQQVFVNSYLINIDKNQANTSFGKTNILDPQASSLSEMAGSIISSMGLSLDQDIATNLLSGIFETTNNLQGSSVSAETFEIITLALRAGGQKPVLETTTPAQPPSQATDSAAIFNQFISPQAFDLSKVFGTQSHPQTPNPTSGGPEVVKEIAPQPSPEEVPTGEEAITPEDDWLTPKIYKSGSVG